MRPKHAPQDTAEHRRLAEAPTDDDPWRLWGPYVAGRQWGTVREDYSADGNAWVSFPFDQAHTRAYRWGEDGIAGLCDRYGFLNLAVALWNGHDDRLKERWFGVTNPQGNHGEDVKEFWWDLDATPTHSWAQQLYRYPQAAYPYADLVAGNAARGADEHEYELADTGVLAGDRFFDVVVTHAKGSPDDVCVRISATNHGPDAAPLDLVPQLWFRNTWSWGRDDRRPAIRQIHPPELSPGGVVAVEATHGFLGRYHLYAQGEPEVMFCDNETDDELAFGQPRRSPHPKSAVDRAIVHGDRSLLNPARTGTKVALRYHFDAVAPGESVTIALRLREEPFSGQPFGRSFESVLRHRQAEADEFYGTVIPAGTSEEDTLTARRAFAGLMWQRQHYRYPVAEWQEGDPNAAPPPPRARNAGWKHLYLADIISMPDAWEYPWFAAWDLAFHCVAMAHVDPAFAKNQLILMCREWAQHPDGQLPAYEWDFGDVNPPVHAWAAWQVFVADGGWDHEFLVRIATKLLLNFGWWVNRTDPNGSQLFSGGFLGLDNISIIDRSHDVPDGWELEQSDATSWMAFFCLSMLTISLELARRDDAWDDLATTFTERFVAIAEAMDVFGPHHTSLWDDEDGFFYDVLVNEAGTESHQLHVRSMVGLLPLLAVSVAPDWVADELTDYTARLRWLQRRFPGRLAQLLTATPEADQELTFAIVPPDRLQRMLGRMFDEGEFLSPHGIRSLSASYRDGQKVAVGGEEIPISYVPGESTSPMFGGNSNWRGPVWFPVNILLVDAMHTYARAAGRGVRVELPTGSGNWVALEDAAFDLERRLVSLFRLGPDGRRPGDPRHQPTGPLWSAHPTFSEYFNGDSGAGLGASHQTGWTALVAHLICTP